MSSQRSDHGICVSKERCLAIKGNMLAVGTRAPIVAEG